MDRGVVYLEHIEASRSLLFRTEVRRWCWARWHRLTKKRYGWRDLVFHVFVWLAWLSPLVVNTAINLSLKVRLSIPLVAIWLLANAAKAWRDLAPTHWIQAREEFAKRQVYLGKVMKDFVPRSTRAADVRAIQCQCLSLIAGYARAWRWDVTATQIFANLLVVDPGGQTVTVIARDREPPVMGSRPVPKTYPIETRAAIKRCIDTGRICEVGDLKVELPEAPEEDYRNIIAIPLRRDPTGPVDAIVSIDSSEPYHFSLEAVLLEQHLQPYLSGIECTL